MPRRLPVPPPPDRWENLRRLTSRDRLLLSWLAEHYLLSTAQITRALFPDPRTARQRLMILHRIGALTRWVDVSATGSRQYLYALGPLGQILHPYAYHDPDNTGAKPPRSHLERINRLVGSRTLTHLLGVNGFFTNLHAHTRTDPQARLVRWWSEQHATTAYATAAAFAGNGGGIRPDGHGIWQVTTAAGLTHRVGFFLEHDTGTEPLRTVLRKLRAYESLARVGPAYPVLLWVPGTRRERHLLDALTGMPAAVPVATAVHSDDPAGPVWTLAADRHPPRHLHELPSSSAGATDDDS